MSATVPRQLVNQLVKVVHTNGMKNVECCNTVYVAEIYTGLDTPSPAN